MKMRVLIGILLIIVFTSACSNKGIFHEYIKTIEVESNSIKNSLENDELTQIILNNKSYELLELWNGALSILLEELEIKLSKEEFEELKGEQSIWIFQKENLVEEAGVEFENGSIYQLIVNSEEARITEERFYELYNKYYKHN